MEYGTGGVAPSSILDFSLGVLAFSSFPDSSRCVMRRSRGFTLVELLVVLGVVLVLGGLTLSALSGARKAAQSVACLSNLRQLAAAATEYAARFDTSYPPAQWAD